MLSLVVVPLTAVIGGAVVIGSHGRPFGIGHKILALVPAWSGIVLTVGLVGAVLEQRGLHSAVRAPAPGAALGIGFAFATVVVVGLWFVLPPVERERRNDGVEQVPALALASTEHAAWIRSASVSLPFLWLFVVVPGGASAAVGIGVIGTHGTAWPLALLPIVILVLVLSTFAWTVRADETGFRVRSALGLPRFSIPIGEIESADVVDVDPIGQFGGWGVRIGLRRRLGIILRAGSELEVHAVSRRSIVVTVDDAASASSLINGLVHRASLTTLPDTSS